MIIGMPKVEEEGIKDGSKVSVLIEMIYMQIILPLLSM